MAGKSRTAVADGGDLVASNLFVLSLPAVVLRSHVRTLGRPTHLLLRAQISLVYLVAALSKLWDPRFGWRSGVAVPQWLVRDSAVADTGVAAIAEHVLSWPPAGAVVTWGAVALELALGLALLLPPHVRRRLLMPGIALHVVIAFVFAVPSFALTMIVALFFFLRAPVP